MNRDATDQAYDEYFTTGNDPTGGEIGPDFNPETGEYLDEEGTEEPLGIYDSIEERIDAINAELDRMISEGKGSPIQTSKDHDKLSWQYLVVIICLIILLAVLLF